jgi:hypothetical protein
MTAFFACSVNAPLRPILQPTVSFGATLGGDPLAPRRDRLALMWVNADLTALPWAKSALPRSGVSVADS